jgi:hypothetical protein
MAALLLLGVLSGLLPDPWSGWLAITAFTAALYVEIASLRLKPDRRWHLARAAAEAVKTLAWRYSVGGAPFGASLPPPQADNLFLERLHLSMEQLDDAGLIAELASANQITESMRSLRATDLATRQRAYVEERLQPQIKWYVDKGAHSARWHDRLSLGSIALAATGLMLGIMHTAGILTVNLWSLVATGGAVTTGWSETRQHGRNAIAYARTAQELASIRAHLPHVGTEDEWAGFVENAESTVSREHSLWQASRADSKVGR